MAGKRGAHSTSYQALLVFTDENTHFNTPCDGIGKAYEWSKEGEVGIDIFSHVKAEEPPHGILFLHDEDYE
jgi:hypothetical protein